MARDFASAIKIAADYLHEDYIQNHLENQQKFYKRFYNWGKKAQEWEGFLRGAIDDKK